MAANNDPTHEPGDDALDYQEALRELAARKGLTVWRHGLIDIKDAKTGEMKFTSPNSQHAYGVLLNWPDRDET